MSRIMIMAMPTIVVVLLKNKLTSLDKINRVKKIMRFANIFNLSMIFFTPYNLETWITYLIFWTLFVGIQKEVFIKAKSEFIDFVIENSKSFIFIPTSVEQDNVRGVLTLESDKDFVQKAEYVGNAKLEKNTKYSGIKVYLSVDGFGFIKKVFCSN